MPEPIHKNSSAKKAPRNAGLFSGYPHIAARVFDRPLLIEESKLNAILHVLSGRMGFGVSGGAAPRPQMWDDGGYEGPTPQEMRAARLSSLLQVQVEPQPEGHFLAGGTAIVPILGTLVQRSSWMNDVSGLTSYEAVGNMFDAALADGRAQEILLELDSPGGEVAGAFDLAEHIFESRTVKPITAFAGELAASAGYLLASSAGQIVMPRTGAVGSIGVVTAHVDYSDALKQDGIAVTFVYAGEKKIDGNAYQPLGDRAKADLQAEIDTLYQLFADTVARNRGMTADQVRATKAGMFLGSKAVDARLLDGIDSFYNEVTRSVTRPGARSRLSSQLETQMDPKDKANRPAGEQTHAPAELDAARTEARAEGAAAGAKAERDRIKAICTHADAEGRGALAAHLAFETDMAAEAATAMLGKSPKVVAEAGRPGALAALMDKLGTPEAKNLPATATATADQPVIEAASIFERRRQASGAK